MWDRVAYLATLLGLGGTGDVIPLDQALLHVRTQSGVVCLYHNIVPPHGFGARLHQRFLNISHDGSIDVAFVRQTTQDAVAELVFGRPTPTLGLPFGLSHLPHVYQLCVNRQVDIWSCGYWSPFNAVALNAQLAGDQAIDLRAMNTHAAQLRQDLQERLTRLERTGTMANSALMYSCARSINPIAYHDRQNQQDLAHLPIEQIVEQNRLFVLQFGVGGDEGNPTINDIWPDFIINPPGDEDQFANVPADVLAGLEAQDEGGHVNPVRQWANDELTRLMQQRIDDRTIRRIDFFAGVREQIYQLVDNNQPGAFHFICNVNGGAHWFLASIVILRDRNPILTICDSSPGFTRGHPATFYPYIQFLHERYIAPYMQ